ncbi:MAG: LLM class flavin-dependent oxidoreductase [Chloroflexi bacterium]|nr:LLM class flavin-dependent oxidoreductase [Chloroflexota bacterium]
MKFAVLLPQTNQVASTDAILRAAAAAEELGFDAVSVHDHIQFNGWWIASGSRTSVPGGDDRTLFEAVTTLAFVAARTARVRLLTSILLLPVRDPIVLAKQIATVDVLSGGRFTCGVGVGPPLEEAKTETTRLAQHRTNAEKEYAAFGLRGNRGPRMDEHLQAMISVWTQEKATFRGRYVSFEDLDVFPKPLQRPRPPLWVGGRSEFAMERCARFGDVWNPSQTSPRQYAESLPVLRAKFAAHGRPAPSEYATNIFTAIAETDELAERIAAPAVGPMFYSDGEFRARTIVGGPATWVRILREWEKVGLTYCEIKPTYHTVDDLVAQLRLIAREVMPAFAASERVSA